MASSFSFGNLEDSQREILSNEMIPRVENVCFLTGATASGKSQLGIEWAEKWNAEIISMDSMAIYRKMDIGTAKPTLEERKNIPHHLIDILDPCEEFSLADYLRLARIKVEEIRSRNKIPLFVGGTPLYLKGLLRGVFLGPAADSELRHELQEQEAAHGVGFLHNQLQKCDPVSALRLHPNDQRRIIRALEVYEKTGQPISTFQKQFDIPASPESVRVWVLDWDRNELYQRINNRVDLMMSVGFLEEVRSLLKERKPLSKTASQAVGYRELIDYIENRRTLEDAVDQIKLTSRHFAKRQGTWFRSMQECQFISVDSEKLAQLSNSMSLT